MATQANAPDDLDAVRAVVEALKGFEAGEQRRIIRWAEEKLGLAPAAGFGRAPMATAPGEVAPIAEATAARSGDIRSFVLHKQPGSDNQFAAVVAYYHAFEAPVAQRKSEIGADDLREAARLAGQKRLRKPIATLHAAALRGYLDKGKPRGTFRLNAVGENLVAMTLPGGTPGAVNASRAKRKSGAKKMGGGR